MTESNIAAELDSLQNQWDTSKPKKFESVPDGAYKATISEMTVKKSSSQKILVVTKFVITGIIKADAELKEEDLLEKPVYLYSTIDSEEGMAYFKGLCQVIGCELPGKMADLQAALNEFVAEWDSEAKIQVKEGKNKDGSPTGFKNIYCNGLVTNS